MRMCRVMKVVAQRRQDAHAGEQHRQPQRGQNQERDVPAELAAQIDAGGHADDRRDREGRHQDPGRPAAPLFRKHVGDDRQRQPAQNASERAREHPGHEQHVISGRETAEERPEQKARVKRQERRLAAEPVHDRRGQQARQARRDRVRRHDPAKLRRCRYPASAATAGPAASRP